MILNTISDKKAYVKPEINVVEIEATDILTVSGDLEYGDPEDDGVAC